MGFFGIKLKSKQDKGSKSNVLDLAYKQECKVCPLNDVDLIHPKMKPTGSNKPIIYIIGEAPGKNEDEQGIQFVGVSGKLLRKVLNSVFGSLDDIRFNNVIRCRPSDTNRNPTDLEIECCRKAIESDIIETKPDIVIGTGAIPLKWFLNTKAGIMLWRGRNIPVKLGSHSFLFYPVLHPAFVLRNESQYGTSAISQVFEKDIENVLSYVDVSGVDSISKNGIIQYREDNIETIKKELSYFSTKCEYVSIDIETNMLKPFNKDAKILSIAIGTDTKIVTFPIEYGDDKEYSREVLSLLKEFLVKSGKKIVHNLKFELIWFCKYFGKDILYETEWEDTQAQAYVIDERSGQGILGLNSLCLQYFGIDLKSYSNINIKNLQDCELGDLLFYNGIDVKYTYKLFKRQQEILNNKDHKKLNNIYKQLVSTAITLASMENRGLLVDVDKVSEISKQLNDEIKDIEKLIDKLEEVKLFSKSYNKFNHKSNKDLKLIFQEVLGLARVKETTKGGYSVDKEVLNEFSKQGVKLAELLIRFREIDKLRSTYIDSIPKYLEHSKDILRPEFNHLFVVTGRLSSKNPNVQNIPKRKNSYVRSIIIAPKNHWFVSIDYSQLEARILAELSDEMNIIKTDIHTTWTLEVVKAYPKAADISTDKKLKEYRSIIKNALVFPWFYGAGKKLVSQTLGLPDNVVSKLSNKFWKSFSRIHAWQEELQKFYNKNQYVEAFTGRRRRAPLDRNQIFNTLPQGIAAFDIVICSMNRLAKLGYKLDKKQYQAVMNIHDDLSFYLPDKTLDNDIEFICKEMVRLPSFIKKIDLEVEVSVGKNWYELEEIGKFSTKDFKYND